MTDGGVHYVLTNFIVGTIYVLTVFSLLFENFQSLPMYSQLYNDCQVIILAPSYRNFQCYGAASG